MNTATTILDNTRATGAPQAASHAKGASESTGSEPQQRFADVLPLVQAAMEQAANNSTAEKVPAKTRSTKGQGIVEPSGGNGRPGRRHKETSSAEAQVSAWPFGGMVHPLIQRQASPVTAEAQNVKAAAGQQTTESKATKGMMKGVEGASAAQASVNTGVVAARTPQSASMTGQTAGAASAAATEPKGVAPQTQQAATAGKQAPVVTQPVPQNAEAVSATSASSISAGDKRAGRSERAQGAAVPGVDVPASQGNAKPDATAAAKAKAAGQSTVAQETAGQTPTKAQSTDSRQTDGSQAAMKSAKDASDSGSVVEGHAETAAKPAASALRGSSKGEPTQRAIKETTASGVKDAAAATTDPRVAAGGESISAAQHAARPTQSQANVDAASARSPVQSVGEQILDSIRSTGTPGEREVLVRLQPPELGMVVVRFQERGESLTGTLEVGTKEARREVEQALPQVLRGLQEAGVLVRRVEVVTSDQPDRNLGGEHLPQDTWQQHQGTGQGREHSSSPSQTYWSQGTGERSSTPQTNSGEESRTAAAPGRIDVLL